MHRVRAYNSVDVHTHRGIHSLSAKQSLVASSTLWTGFVNNVVWPSFERTCWNSHIPKFRFCMVCIYIALIQWYSNY